MSTLTERLVSVKFNFLHISARLKEEKLQKGKNREGNLQGQVKETSRISNLLWGRWGLHRRESCISCTWDRCFHKGGSAIWPLHLHHMVSELWLMELAEEEPHALSVFHHHLTKSYDYSVFINTGAMPVFLIHNWQFLHLRELTTPPPSSSQIPLVVPGRFSADWALQNACLLLTYT